MGQNTTGNRTRTARNTTDRILRLCGCLFLLAALFFSACGKNTEVSAVQEMPEIKRQIRLQYSDGSTAVLTVSPEQEIMLPEACPDEGYSCYAWEDAFGTRYVPGSTSDGLPDTLIQRCAVKLGDETEHRAFLFADEDGDYDLDGLFTWRRAAQMFEALLMPRQDEYPFEGLDLSDPAAGGAARLRAYGMIGEEFDPDRPVTCEELYRLVSFCFPPPEGKTVTDETAPDSGLRLAAEMGWIDMQTLQPDQTLSVRDAVQRMEKILSRRTAMDRVPAEVFASAADLAGDEELFCDLIEAAVTHTCSVSGTETWETWTIHRRLEPGPRTIGNKLYWVRGDGLFAVSQEENGLLFDEQGCYTSGNTELDRMVQQILNEILTDEMTQYEKLRAVYDYSLQELHYGKGGRFEKGTDDWWQEEAVRMLRTKRGNCYSFAAAFCALSRPLGYDTKVVSGSTFGSGVHGWAYILFDGEEHIFDPQAEQRGVGKDMFDMLPEKWEQFSYDPAFYPEETEPESAEG